MRPMFLYNSSLFVISVLLVSIMYGFLSYYVGNRILQILTSYKIYYNSKIYWILFWIIDFSYIAARFSGNILPPTVLKYITTIGAFWLAVMLYFFMLCPIRDLIIFIIGKKIKNRTEKFEKLKKISGSAVIISVFIIITYGYINATHPRIHHYDINISKSAGNYKDLHIVMVSDIHLGTIISNSRLEKLINSTNKLNPDIILLPGDVIDEDIAPFVKQNMKDTFSKLHPKLGCYAILGNHEYAGKHQDEIIKKLTEANVNILKDKSVKIDNSFYIVGRDDISGEKFNNKKREQLSKLMRNFDTSLPVILMDHQPKDFKEAVSQRVDLQLSGHTHAGQIFPGSLITKASFEDYWGYMKKGNLQVIVSSGYGTWGPPIRTGNYPEIVDIMVHFKS